MGDSPKWVKSKKTEKKEKNTPGTAGGPGGLDQKLAVESRKTSEKSPFFLKKFIYPKKIFFFAYIF